MITWQDEIRISRRLRGRRRLLERCIEDDRPMFTDAEIDAEIAELHEQLRDRADRDVPLETEIR